MRLLSKELEEFLNKIHEKNVEKELLAYVKSRAIPLVIRLSAKLGEKELINTINNRTLIGKRTLERNRAYRRHFINLRTTVYTYNVYRTYEK